MIECGIFLKPIKSKVTQLNPEDSFYIVGGFSNGWKLLFLRIFLQYWTHSQKFSRVTFEKFSLVQIVISMAENWQLVWHFPNLNGRNFVFLYSKRRSPKIIWDMMGVITIFYNFNRRHFFFSGSFKIFSRVVTISWAEKWKLSLEKFCSF